MIRRLSAIALNTFREAVRHKVLHISIIFVVIMIVFSLFVGEISFNQNRRVFLDFGLFFISLLGVFLAIFTGVNLIFKEIDRKSIYLIVAKPVRRWEFLIGKYIGGVLTLTVALLIMNVVFLGIMAYLSAIEPLVIKALLLIAVEVFLILAVAAFFSSYSTPLLSSFFSAGLYLVGHLSDDLYGYSQRSKSFFMQQLGYAVHSIFDLSIFSINTAAIHVLPVTGEYLLYTVAYAAVLTTLFLFIGCVALSRRDLF